MDTTFAPLIIFELVQLVILCRLLKSITYNNVSILSWIKLHKALLMIESRRNQMNVHDDENNFSNERIIYVPKNRIDYDVHRERFLLKVRREIKLKGIKYCQRKHLGYKNEILQTCLTLSYNSLTIIFAILNESCG